tara:strand:+ start:290 stop:511 length:222 start_codon:yes stop_codon:yes gene_type:complete
MFFLDYDSILFHIIKVHFALSGIEKMVIPRKVSPNLHVIKISLPGCPLIGRRSSEQGIMGRGIKFSAVRRPSR